MLETMKSEISEGIKKAYASGSIKVEEIENIVSIAVSKVAQSAKNEAIDINNIAKEAIQTAVAELKSIASIKKAQMEAVINGTINGISKDTRELISNIDMELLKTKYRLQEQEDILSVHLKEVLAGAKEAAAIFSDDTQSALEDIVTETKLKSIEALGLMQDTIKHSVHATINEGKDIEARVEHIVRKAVENALDAGRLSAQKVKEVSQTVILAAIEAAEESGKKVKETTKGAIKGAMNAVTSSIEKSKLKLQKLEKTTEGIIEEDYKQTVETLEAMNGSFIEALSNIANRVEKSARNILQKSIAEMKEYGSIIEKNSKEKVSMAIGYLKEKGSVATHAATETTKNIAKTAKEEINDLSEKMITIAKGTVSGVVKTTKKDKKKK
jgi:hypothetical protein